MALTNQQLLEAVDVRKEQIEDLINSLRNDLDIICLKDNNLKVHQYAGVLRAMATKDTIRSLISTDVGDAIVRDLDWMR